MSETSVAKSMSTKQNFWDSLERIVVSETDFARKQISVFHLLRLIPNYVDFLQCFSDIRVWSSLFTVKWNPDFHRVFKNKFFWCSILISIANFLFWKFIIHLIFVISVQFTFLIKMYRLISIISNVFTSTHFRLYKKFIKILCKATRI